VAAAALAVALAASLCAMAARLSAAQLPSARELGADAERLRDLAAPLAEADARAYAGVIAALRLPKEADPDRRSRVVAAALAAAADVPLQVAEAGAAVVALAARLAADGNPNLRGDAVTAGLLAEAGARRRAPRRDQPGRRGRRRKVRPCQPPHAGSSALGRPRAATGVMIPDPLCRWCPQIITTWI
jgi:hypothetical protein